MSLVLRRCLKANGCLLSASTTTITPRSFSDEKFSNEAPFSHSTIMIENGLNVHELPLVIRRVKTISEVDQQPTSKDIVSPSDSQNYHLIQEEFMQCLHLRDVFSLLTKCTKITPNIALGAIERIYDLEKNPPAHLNVPVDSIHINLAKGAILDKLLRVVTKTEDTQTILNILSTVSSFMDPYKPKFCDELLLRVVENKLTIEQLCEFMDFLIKNKPNAKYSETIDKLWVGFLEKEQDIDDKNIKKVFQVLKGFKSSKKTILTLLEQKFSDLWNKISVSDMQDILDVFEQEKYVSLQSFAVVGSWLYANIHALNQESMLDIVSKLTRMKYTDHQVEKAIEKYMTLKGTKIDMHVLVVGILNYCLQFQIRNEKILNTCSDYFVNKGENIPISFLKSFAYPYGYLNYNPLNSLKFWALTERMVDENFSRLSADDICFILLSFIYTGHYPLSLTNRLFKSEYLLKVNNPDTMKKLCLIDTALSLECTDYSGPMLPKDSWSKPVSQDIRIKNILKKTKDVFESVAGGPDMLSLGVMVPHIYSDDTYLIDVMLHSAGMGSNTFNWKSKSGKENIAILIHLPDHYCSENDHLVGPQVMREKHLKILGLKVVSIKYSMLSQYYTSCNTSGFRQYLVESISQAED